MRKVWPKNATALANRNTERTDISQFTFKSMVTLLKFQEPVGDALGDRPQLLHTDSLTVTRGTEDIGQHGDPPDQVLSNDLVEGSAKRTRGRFLSNY